MKILAYKRKNGTITTVDYIDWSHRMLAEGHKSAALFKLSAVPVQANLFEIEGYFHQALSELELQLPTLELNSIEVIQLFVTEILQATDDQKIIQLAHDIFHIVAELGYPDDLLEWYEISEMQDRLTYDQVQLFYNQQHVIQKIKETARKLR